MSAQQAGEVRILGRIPHRWAYAVRITHAFAREGAKVSLAGRTLANLNKSAEQIIAAGRNHDPQRTWFEGYAEKLIYPRA